MRFYTFKEKKPAIGEYILAKLKEDTKETESIRRCYKDYIPCPYYVLEVKKERCWGKDVVVYVEAMGEGYAEWEENELIGWVSLSEIEKAERWEYDD